MRLCEPELANRRTELDTVIATKDRLAEELRALAEQIRTLKNDIDVAGGQRLRDIPGLIREEAARRETKEQASIRYHELLSKCAIRERVQAADQFTSMRLRLQSDLETHRQQGEKMSRLHEERLAQRAVLSRQIQDEQTELQILSQRQTSPLTLPRCAAAFARTCSWPNRHSPSPPS